MTLGEKIRAARMALGLTQAQLAEQLMVSRPAVTKWEADKGIPDIDNLKLIAQYLGVSLDELLADDGSADTRPSLEMEGVSEAKTEARVDRLQRLSIMGRVACCTILIDLLLSFICYWIIKDAAAVVLPILLACVPILLYRLWGPQERNRKWLIGGSIACLAITMAIHPALYALYTTIAYGKNGLHLILWKDLIFLTGGMILLELAGMIPFLVGKHSKTPLSVLLGYVIILGLTLLCTIGSYILIEKAALPSGIALLIGSIACIVGLAFTLRQSDHTIFKQ